MGFSLTDVLAAVVLDRLAAGGVERREKMWMSLTMNNKMNATPC